MLGRQLGIVYLLLLKKNVTAAELAERFEVSVRTIYRDVEALSLAGIPIYTRKGKNGGISLTENFVLDKMVLSKEEQETILAALESMQQTRAIDEKTLRRLGNFFQMERESWVAIDFSDWSGRRNELFEQIKSAILCKRLMRFDYYGQNNVMTNRTVEPVQLVFKEFTWYLRAYCRERNAMRLFKVMRMKRAVCLEEGFVPDVEKYRESNAFTAHEARRRNGGTERAGAEGSAGRAGVEEIILRVDASEAWRIYDRFEEEEVTGLENGGFLIRMRVPVDEWIYGMIMSFGPAAEVLGPAGVREEVQRRLRKALQNYFL